MSEEHLQPGHHGAEPDEGQLPVELLAMHHQLQRDGAAWRSTVPDNARLNARVRTLPLELPRSSRTRERGLGAGIVIPRRHARLDASDSLVREGLARGDMMRSGMVRKVGAWAGGAAAMLVVLLLVGLLVQMANGQAGGQRQIASGTVGVPPTPAATPYGEPTDTPTIGAVYVTSAVTASHIDGNGNPVNPTSTFQTGQQVFVVAHVNNPPTGQHHLTIWWFLNGQQVQEVAEGVSGKMVTGTTNVFFTAVYTSAGRGTARLYWDMPPSTPASQADTYLARDVAFDVQGPAGAPTATPLPGRTPTPGPTWVATPTLPPTPTPTPS